nr:VOC family protein [Auraticoccus cholistanensis]
MENLVLDAADPWLVGRFWTEALGLEVLTDDADGYEARLEVPGGPVLDLCVQPVPEPATAPSRLHLDLSGLPEPEAVVERLLGLGARRLDIGQGPDVPWTVLADPEGTPFCVLERRERHEGAGPLGEIPVEARDPDRDAAFWAGLSGWRPEASDPRLLRHPSGRGPLLSFTPERGPKQVKNRLHLDLRLEPGDDADAVLEQVVAGGGSVLEPAGARLPWTLLADPSGNEFCLLPNRG